MIEKVSLFKNKRDFFHLFILIFVLFSLSISYEFYNYKELTKFDSQLCDGIVLKQYPKTKLTKSGKTKTYQVLKIQSDNGFKFYTTTQSSTPDIKYKHIKLEIWAGNISFYEYIHGFYSFSKILQIHSNKSYKKRLNIFVDAQHQDKNASLIYQALFSAKQLPLELQTSFSILGISHLIAISGFHLGVLTTILFFLLKYPYLFIQSRYFPYRSLRRDTFVILLVFLLSYLLFLDSPPSLLRAFIMLIIGFVLYDRGIKIISMQTLLLSSLLILALFPRLMFSIGLFLSLAGVFYIYLFLIYAKNLSKVWQSVLLPIWVYLMMLPFSLSIFGNFSLYHPLSIIYSVLFTLFYPLSMLLHLLGIGDILDPLLHYLLSIRTAPVKLEFPSYLLTIIISLSLLSIYKKYFIYFLVLFNLSLLAYSFSTI